MTSTKSVLGRIGIELQQLGGSFRTSGRRSGIGAIHEIAAGGLNL